MHMADFVGKANERPKSGVGICKYLIDDYGIGNQSFANSYDMVPLL